MFGGLFSALYGPTRPFVCKIKLGNWDIPCTKAVWCFLGCFEVLFMHVERERVTFICFFLSFFQMIDAKFHSHFAGLHNIKPSCKLYPFTINN